MVEKMAFHHLKFKLAEYLNPDPVIWEKLRHAVQITILYSGEYVMYEPGSIVFIAEGLLKEYDARQRRRPVIINFLNAGNFVIAARYHQHRYLKAVLPVTLVTLGFDEAIALYIKHHELLPLYRAVAANYEGGTLFRYALLEERFTEKRIRLFINRYRAILPFLKKKDMASYLHIEYDYFVRLYGRML